MTVLDDEEREVSLMMTLNLKLKHLNPKPYCAVFIQVSQIWLECNMDENDM